MTAEVIVKLVLIQPQLPSSDVPMMAAIEGSLSGLSLSNDDVVLLPEHTHRAASREAYLADIRALADRLGAHVVGGSHHQPREGGAINTGVVVAPNGEIVGDYEKLRPYAAERQVVRHGTKLGELTLGGRRLLITICADFWFTDLFLRAAQLPDVVLVPAYSVTRKPTPDYSKALWRHLAIARAYELGVYVGISDWGYSPEAPKPTTSGVGGFADPTTVDPDSLFTPVGDEALVVEVSFEALDAFRADRLARGFFWRNPPPSNKTRDKPGR
jgi:predicted amidohydrolase